MLIIAIILCILNIELSSVQCMEKPQEVHAILFEAFQPALLKKARMRGLYSPARLPVSRRVNPYYLRGDLNGDGCNDLAFWVTSELSDEAGVAVLHSSLDSLYLFGAGKPFPNPESSRRSVFGNQWRVLPRGHVIEHPGNSIPDIGLYEGQPFILKRETVEIAVLGKSAFALYWERGEYHFIWTAD